MLETVQSMDCVSVCQAVTKPLKQNTYHVHRTFRDVIRVPLAPSAGGGAGGGGGGGGGVKKQRQSFVF